MGILVRVQRHLQQLGGHVEIHPFDKSFGLFRTLRFRGPSLAECWQHRRQQEHCRQHPAPNLALHFYGKEHNPAPLSIQTMRGEKRLEHRPFQAEHGKVC